MTALQDAFNNIEGAMFMTHHELAKETYQTFNSQQWKEFITDPRVDDWLEDEMIAYRRAKIRAMTKNIDKIKSPGHAQLLNTMISQEEKKNKKDGPAFIYCHIPLSEEEMGAENVRVLKNNPIKD